MRAKKHERKLKYFTKGEIALWLVSFVLITLFFFVFDRENYLTQKEMRLGRYL